MDTKTKFLRKTMCSDLTDEEFGFFDGFAKRLGLDPSLRQIWPVKRWNKKLNKTSLTVQTGIDGYRLIADRTGKYCPGKAAEFTHSDDGSIISAKAFIKKQTQDGTWNEVSAVAYFEEYVQKDRSGNPTEFWKTKGHIMLSKCAEALCIRMAFPAELSGIYTKEEMAQADNPSDGFNDEKTSITRETLENLSNLLKGKADLLRKVLTRYGVEKLSSISEKDALVCISKLEKIKEKDISSSIEDKKTA